MAEVNNCYFWIDQSIPEDNRGISVICENCHKKNPDIGWFWDGNKGYGPYKIVCDLCQFVVHEDSASKGNSC